MKCLLHNVTVQYVNKSISSIVKVKVLTDKNLLMFLALKTAQFLSSRDVVLWTELITNKGFSEKTTCPAIPN